MPPVPGCCGVLHQTPEPAAAGAAAQPPLQAPGDGQELQPGTWGHVRECRGRDRELCTPAPGSAAGKGRQQPWGSLALGAWVRGSSLEEHRRVATDAP